MLKFRVWLEGRKNRRDDPAQKSLWDYVPPPEPEPPPPPAPAAPKPKAKLRHYWEAKKRHPGMIILFRTGDVYEMFGEDAERASSVLGIPVTHIIDDDEDDMSITYRPGQGGNIAMATFNHTDLENNLRKLLKSKLRVAIADQVS